MHITPIELLMVGALVAVIVYYLFFKEYTDKEGRLDDWSINTDKILQELASFQVVTKPHLKKGYTRYSLQKQLQKHLGQTFAHVHLDRKIKGEKINKIALDIGHGKVGIDIKVARSPINMAYIHKLESQVEDLVKAKYSKNNLILIIFVEAGQKIPEAMFEKIGSRVGKMGGRCVFCVIPPKVNESESNEETP